MIPTNKEREVLENMEKAQEEHFAKLHSKELMSIGRNFTADEQQDVCRVISTRYMEQELKRREEAIVGILKELMETLSKYDESMGLSEMESLLTDVRKVVKVQ